MGRSIIERTISDLIIEPIESMGFDVVRVKLYEDEISTLQVMAERVSDGELGVDDCANISRTISMILDLEDPIKDEYNLEVSSPGVDRPLTRAKDFRKYAGEIIKLTASKPINGRKRYKGILIGISDDDKNITIEFDDLADNAVIEFDNVDTAKLVLTNDLLAREAAKRKN